MSGISLHGNGDRYKEKPEQSYTLLKLLLEIGCLDLGSPLGIPDLLPHHVVTKICM